jgi:hypothetical protein
MGSNFGYILLDRPVDSPLLLSVVRQACLETEVRVADVSVARPVDLASLFIDPPTELSLTTLVVEVDGGAHPGLDEIAERITKRTGCAAVAGEVSDYYASATFQSYRRVYVGPHDEQLGTTEVIQSGLVVDRKVAVGGVTWSYLDVAWLAVEALFDVRLAMRDELRPHAAREIALHPGTLYRVIECGKPLDPARVIVGDDVIEASWRSMGMTVPIAARWLHRSAFGS